MWSSQLSPILLALAASTCAGFPLLGGIIPMHTTITLTPTFPNATILPVPLPTWNTTRHVTRHTPIPLPPARTKTLSDFWNTTITFTPPADTGVIPDPVSTVPAVAARGDIHSAVTTATLYSNGHAYTVTQYSEVNPELSTIELMTTVEHGTVLTTPATIPIVSARSGTGSPWRASVTATSMSS
ncbi:hypothetical protein F5B19DRAFT_195300 [Rostrohypoxylon terebratum]|nr:hypothetical protein F5B19DRAFT_195300 [Rostrohypoxylon terebratum]